MSKKLSANDIATLPEKERKQMFADLRLLDVVEGICKLPMHERAVVVLHTLSEFPELARTPRGLALIRVCKEAITKAEV